MLYRFASILIVIFWIVMTGILVRREIGLGSNALREVPVSHVVRLMFKHEQKSDLHVYHDRLRIGHLHIEPRVRKEDGRRVLEFSGNLQVIIPGLARRNVAWGGEVEMDAGLEVERLQLNFSFNDPSRYRLDLLVEPRERRLTYETRAGDRTLDRGEYPLDEKGAMTWLREQGLDPAVLKAIHNPKAAPPVIRALQSSMEIHGERIDTYLISVEQGGQTMLEFHVSQLGNVLQATSFLGYSATPYDSVP